MFDSRFLHLFQGPTAKQGNLVTGLFSFIKSNAPAKAETVQVCMNVCPFFIIQFMVIVKQYVCLIFVGSDQLLLKCPFYFLNLKFLLNIWCVKV